MEQINNHSPLPWVKQISVIESADGIILMQHEPEENTANGEFIVTACNSYYQSQETISALTERVKELESMLNHFVFMVDPLLIPGSPALRLQNTLNSARALLTPKNNGE